jgi:hypothetical protein
MMECRLAGETEVLGENLPQRHFCPSQNPTCPPGFESGPPRWEAGDYPPELWRGLSEDFLETLYLKFKDLALFGKAHIRHAFVTRYVHLRPTYVHKYKLQAKMKHFISNKLYFRTSYGFKEN